MTVARGTNWVLCLILVMVAGITGLNQYTTNATCALYMDGVTYNNEQMARNKMVYEAQCLVEEGNYRSDLLADVAQSQAVRAEKVEAEFDDLANRYVEANASLRDASIEIYNLNECVNEFRNYIQDLQRAVVANENRAAALDEELQLVKEELEATKAELQKVMEERDVLKEAVMKQKRPLDDGSETTDSSKKL